MGRERNQGIFLLVFIGLSVVYGIIAWLVNADVFRDEAIDYKYCYYMENDTIGEVHATYKKEDAYQVICYEYCGFKNRGSLVIENMYSLGKEVTEVEILEYTQDSILARIRYKYFTEQRGGFIIETKSFVPSFTLHDTFPEGYKPKNSKYMKNENQR